MKGINVTVAFVLISLLVGAPLAAYTIYLKDGSRLIARQPPEIEEGMAIITLQNGTQTSLAASEIDIERTRQANQHELGSALILEGGEFTEAPTAPPPEKDDRLSDLIRKNRASAETRPRPETGARIDARPADEGSTTASDLFDWRRNRYRDLEIAAEIQGVFRGQGVEQVRLFQGTEPDRLLVDLTTDSEAAVFRGLRVAAAALARVQSSFPEKIEAFELVLMTSNRGRAGQFLLDGDRAAQLLGGEVDVSTFFVENVIF